MPFDLLTAHAGLILAAAAKKKATTSNETPVLIFILVIGGAYLLFLRPQRQRQRAALQAQRQVEVGDEVVTTAGIYGRILSFDGDRALVEIAPGTTIEVARRALGQRVDPIEIPSDEPEADGAGTGFGQPGYDGHDDLDVPDENENEDKGKKPGGTS